jgi:hypothetical protein
MQRLFLILRDVVWSAVIAVALAAVSVLSALVDPSNVALPVSLGLSAVVSAFLAQRA